MNYKIICGDCLKVLEDLSPTACIFADPPDNLGLTYGNDLDDDMPTKDYIDWLEECLRTFCNTTNVVWFSYNARWISHLGKVVLDLWRELGFIEIKHCIQTFTFGQHNQHDLGNCFRPLLRLKRDDAPLYPNQIRIPSRRQECGDKRADSRGRVPGDVFNFPRVTGNSSQRRSWSPTQLHEGLIERCIKLSTKEGDTILDPFAGTGTTLRVCKRINRNCILIEQNPEYCNHIAREHGLNYEMPHC